MDKKMAFITSPVKREKLQRQMIQEEKDRMRAELPVYNAQEIRRCRRPYDEAIISELEENGFTSSASFITQLLQFQETMVAEHGPDSIVSSRPKLKNSKKCMDRLYEGLQNAEKAHYDDKIKTECDELLHLGVFFGFGKDDWWWLGEQLLIQAVYVSSNYAGDGGEREAIGRFAFGKFLYENLRNPESALKQLQEARLISMGKSFTAYKIFKQKQKSVFMEVCQLLSNCYLKQASDMMAHNTAMAAKLCELSIKRAFEACELSNVANSYMLKGRCDMDANLPTSAIVAFQKALSIFNRKGLSNQVCEARIQLALALLAIGNFHDSAYQLKQLLSYAKENNIQEYMAKAYRYLGEYYLNHGSPNMASPILMMALNMFHQQGDYFNRDQVRTLAAISQGQEILPAYIKLVLNAGKPKSIGASSLKQLLEWKDSRKPFWGEHEARAHSVSQADHSLASIPEIEDELGADDGKHTDVAEDVPSKSSHRESRDVLHEASVMLSTHSTLRMGPESARKQ